MRTAECLCGCEGSGDPPFLLACPLPPFSQPSPCFPAGNRWGGQVTRANTSPVGPWRNGSRHSGEFLAGQDSRAVYFASRGRKGPFMQISQLVTVGCRPASCPVEPPPPPLWKLQPEFWSIQGSGQPVRVSRNPGGP